MGGHVAYWITPFCSQYFVRDCSFDSITQDISNEVNSSKLKHYECLALKLNDSKTTPEIYWKILKIFVNGMRILLIPPLLDGNQLVTDFLVKANLFNDYFWLVMHDR